MPLAQPTTGGMDVERRPFEIVAECEMAGFPSGADVDRVRERIQEAQHSWPAIVRAAVNPPAVFKDRRYVLQARFVVWAENGGAATQAVEGLLAGAGVQCRTVLPSGRALTEGETPPPAEKAAERRVEPTRAARRTKPARAARPARTTRARPGVKTRAGGKPPAGTKGRGARAAGPVQGRARKTRRGRAARSR